VVGKKKKKRKINFFNIGPGRDLRLLFLAREREAGSGPRISKGAGKRMPCYLFVVTGGEKGTLMNL